MTPPDGSPETQPFWDAAAQGRLLLKRCVETGQCFHYPRARSPFTLGETEWVEAAGTGTIYSLSTMRRGADAPFTVAWVTLDEGPAILTRIATDDHDALAIGQRVRVRFQPVDDGLSYPAFVVDE